MFEHRVPLQPRGLDEPSKGGARLIGGPPAERPIWQKVRSRPDFIKPRRWHIDLVPKDPEGAGFGEVRPERPPSSQGQVGLLGDLVGRPMCA